MALLCNILRTCGLLKHGQLDCSTYCCFNLDIFCSTQLSSFCYSPPWLIITSKCVQYLWERDCTTYEHLNHIEVYIVILKFILVYLTDGVLKWKRKSRALKLLERHVITLRRHQLTFVTGFLLAFCILLLHGEQDLSFAAIV